MRRKQSISYLFKEESGKLLEENNLEQLFECGKGHPIILKRFLGGDISLETFVIYDIISVSYTHLTLPTMDSV